VELTGKRFNSGGRLHKVLSTRKGTALVAGACTVVAAAILVVAATQYRKSVDATTQPETVLVATAQIQKGTPGDLVSSRGMFRAEHIAAKQVSLGAIADASLIHGKVAAADISAGQQITAADFVAGDGYISQLAPDQRAISIPLDTAHGLSGVLHAGDRVDVYAGLDTSVTKTAGSASAGAATKLLIPNVQVISVNLNGGSGIGGNGVSSQTDVVLKVSANAAGALAFAADNGKIWLVLRGANATGPNAQQQVTFTVNSLLLNNGSGTTGGKR
jgi:Flp pilus assembly protein CpaB